MAKQNTPKFKYEGESIFLAGNPGEKYGVTFTNVLPNGKSETISLQVNKAYFVGGKDEVGHIIGDWVYKRAQSNDLNPNRARNGADETLARNNTADGGRGSQTTLID